METMEMNMLPNQSDTQRPAFIIFVQTTVVTITTVLILVGNIVNFIVLNSTPLWHRSTRSLLKNLSVTDFCIGLSFTLFAIPSAANLSGWPYGDLNNVMCNITVDPTTTNLSECSNSNVMCDITSFIGGTCCAASIITLALISVDRYFIIQRPLDHQNYMSVRNVRVLIAFSWLVAVGLHLLPLVELKLTPGKEFSFYNKAAFLCSARYSDFAEHTMLLFFLIFALTNVIIFAVYLRIIPISLKHSKFIRTRGNRSATKRDRLHLITDKSNKSICTLLCITLVFNICWAPMVISLLTEVFWDIEIPSRLEFWFSWSAMSNSFLNTFVYLAMNAKYRMAVKKLFGCTKEMYIIPHRKLSSTYLSACTKQTEV